MKILIVEDEESMGFLMKRALDLMIPDSKVEVIGDPIQMVTTMQALKAGDPAEWPHVVISDFNLHGTTGGDILQVAARLFPETKLVLMSGGADQQDLQASRAKVPRPLTYLPKPFDTEKLVRTIQEPAVPTAP